MNNMLDNTATTSSCPNLTDSWPTEWSSTNRIFGIVTGIIAIVHVLVVFLMLYRHRKNTYLHQLSPLLLFINGCGIILFSILHIMEHYFGKDKMSCDIGFIGLTLIIPLLGGSVIVRIGHFRQKLIFSKEIRSIELNKLYTSASTERKFLTIKYLAGRYMLALTLALLFLPTIIFIIVAFTTTPYLGIGCQGCKITGIQAKFYLVIIIIISISLLVVIRNFKYFEYCDAFEIVRRTKIVVICFMVSIISWFTFGSIDPGDVDKNGNFSWGNISLLGMNVAFVVMITQPIYQIEKQTVGNSVNSIGFGKTNHKIAFKDILSTSAGIEAFFLYNVENLSAMNFRFWVEANKWKELYYNPDKTPRERQIEAEQIYFSFVGTGAVMFINLTTETQQELAKQFPRNRADSDMHMRNRTLRRLTQRRSTTTPKSSFGSTTSSKGEEYDTFSLDIDLVPRNVYDKALEEVYKHMEQNVYPLFLKSEQFGNYRRRAMESQQELNAFKGEL